MKNWTKRGVLHGWNDAVNPQATFLGRSGEVHKVEVFQPFGMSYCPPAELSEAIIMPGQGSNDMLFSPGFTGGKHRPKPEEGGSILYSSADGTEVRANPDGTVAITTKDGGTFTMRGNKITTNMTIETTGDLVAGGVSLKNHVHTRTRPGAGLSGEPQT